MVLGCIPCIKSCAGQWGHNENRTPHVHGAYSLIEDTDIKRVHRKSLIYSCQDPDRIKQWTVQFWMWVEWGQITLQMGLRGQVQLRIFRASWLPRFLWVNEAQYCCRRLLKIKDELERRQRHPQFPIWPGTCTGTWDTGVWWLLNHPFLTSQSADSWAKERTPSNTSAAAHNAGHSALAFILSPVH